MPNFRLAACLGLLLLASQASQATFTKVGAGFSNACAATALGCTVTVAPASTAGDVIIVYLMTSNGANGIASIAGGGTYTICTVCTSKVASGGFAGASSGGTTVEIAYTLTAVAGANSIYLTRQEVSSVSWRIGYIEIRASATHRAEFDTGGARSTLGTGTTVPAGVTLALSGSGAAVLQVLTSDRGTVSVNAADNPTNPNWVSEKPSNVVGNFGAASNMSVLNNSFFWRFGSAGTLAGSAIAFREVSITAPPLVPKAPPGFTTIAQNWSASECASTTTTCSVATSQPTGLGNLIIAYAIIRDGSNDITQVSGGGIYVIAPLATVRDITVNGGGTVMMAYTQSSVAGASNITLTRLNTGSTWRVGYIEVTVGTSGNGFLHYPPGGPAVIDVGAAHAQFDGSQNKINQTLANPQAGVFLEMNALPGCGPTPLPLLCNEFVIQIVYTDRPTINTSTSPAWTLEQSAANYAVAAYPNAADVVPVNWTFDAPGQMIGSALAFYQAFSTSASLGTSASLTSSSTMTGPPPGGGPVITSATLSPSSATVSVGQTLNFSANATFSDGSKSDITPVCNWFDNSGYKFATNAQWFTQPPVNCANQGFCPPVEPELTRARRGDPQNIQFLQNGLTLLWCQYQNHYPFARAASSIQVGPISISPQPIIPTGYSPAGYWQYFGLLPPAHIGTAYSVTFTASGGTPPYTYYDQSNYPLGMQSYDLLLTGNTLSGLPAVGDIIPNISATFVLRVTDSATPHPNVSYFSYDLDFLPAPIVGAGLPVTDENYYDNPDGTCRNMPASDGPAALPTQCFNTLLANTPSPGGTFWVCKPGQTVPAGCNGTPYTTIQSALNATQGASPAIPCGSTIVIASTSDGTPTGTPLTYDEALVIPPVKCDASHWMTVRTDQVNAMPPGSRVSPAWVGAPSMPARPPYSQPPTPGTYMPRIRSSRFTDSEILFTAPTLPTAPQTGYWRFIGLWLAQPGPSSTGTTVCSGHNCVDGWKAAIVETNCLLESGSQVCPDHLIFDRMLVSADDLTGNAVNSVCYGIRTTGSSVAVIDSYIFEIQARVGSLGGNCEPHALGSGNTGAPGSQGPYKYVNNYLEASGENYFWGGGNSVSSPVNVQIRRNHMFKPSNLWMPGRPGYLGVVILIKNIGESKDLHQALIEGNIFQNNWYGPDTNGTFSTDQDGGAVLLHSAPIFTDVHRAMGQDMTFRYNFVQHAVKAIHIDIIGCSACTNFPPGPTAGLTQRVSVHDNVFDDISRRFYTEPNGGSGGFDGSNVTHHNPHVNIGTNGSLNSVKVDHNTFVTSWYSQDITVASIVVSGGTATLTGTGPPVPRQGATGFYAGREVMIWGSCTGYDAKPTIATIVSSNPATFTYATGLPNGTCNTGFVSLIAASVPGSINLGEGSTDASLVALSENGTLASALMSNFSLQIEMCVSAGVPTGCVGSSQFTIWGLTGSLNCYNSNQSAANCPPGGTPANWTLAGRAHCTGLGTGTVIGAGSVSVCRAAGQDAFFWNHPASGLAAGNANALSYLSYWASLGRNNYGPNPNPSWQSMVYTNNIFAGRAQQVAGECKTPGQLHSTTANVLNNCGVVETAGAGAYQFSCNVIVGHALPLQTTFTPDVFPSPLLNTDTDDHTYETVGFTNFNHDNMGQGVTNLSDLALSSSSKFHGGIAGCDGKDTGADITQIQTYTAGVL